jgi:hypothetical protein
MPLTSRVLIKASILYLGLGAILGALLLVNRWVPLNPKIVLLKASHVQVLLAGWLTQLIMGVAWWLFPPLPRHPGAELPVRQGQIQRGSEPLFWVTFVCLNAGVLIRAIFDPLYGWTQVHLYQALSGLSGLLLLAAVVLFVANMWRRTRELGQRT